MKKERIKIRPVRTADSIRYAGLFNQVIGSLKFYSPQARRTEIAASTGQKVKARLKRKNWFELGAFIGNRPIGFCFGTINLGVAWLDWIGVDPEYRGQGIMRQMIGTVAKHLKQRGGFKVWCVVRPNNQVSNSAFKKFGWRQLGRAENFWYKHSYNFWEKDI